MSNCIETVEIRQDLYIKNRFTEIVIIVGVSAVIVLSILCQMHHLMGIVSRKFISPWFHFNKRYGVSKSLFKILNFPEPGPAFLSHQIHWPLFQACCTQNMEHSFKIYQKCSNIRLFQITPQNWTFWSCFLQMIFSVLANFCVYSRSTVSVECLLRALEHSYCLLYTSDAADD